VRRCEGVAVKVYSVTLLVLDLDNLGADGAVRVIKAARCRGLATSVMDVKEREVEWSDDHPLNRNDTADAAFVELFGAKP
jgi:hypothetical protein